MRSEGGRTEKRRNWDAAQPEEWRNWDEAQLDEQLALLQRQKAYLVRAKEEVERLQSEPLPPEVERLCEESFARVDRLIKREFRQPVRHGRVVRVLRKTAQIIAACIAVLTVGAVTAVSVSDSARVQALRYRVEIGDVSTELSMEPTSVVLDVLEGYEGKYFPRKIPEGFELAQVYRDAVQYCTPDGERYFTYHEYSPDDLVSIDTADANISYTECFGVKVMVSEKNGNVMCNWAFDDGFYVLDLDGTKEETIHILKSLTKIIR